LAGPPTPPLPLPSLSATVAAKLAEAGVEPEQAAEAWSAALRAGHLPVAALRRAAAQSGNTEADFVAAMTAAGLLSRRATSGRPHVAEFPDTSPAGLRELRKWAEDIPDAAERRLVLDRLDALSLPEQVLTGRQQRALKGRRLTGGMWAGPDALLEAVRESVIRQNDPRLREAV